MEILGKRIKELRQEKNLTHEQLSREIKVSKAIIGFWENDKAEPTAPNIMMLAIFFNVSTDYLLGLSNNP